MKLIQPASVRARLTVYGLPGMNKIELRRFRKWMSMLAVEMMTEDPKNYSKIFRATLYNPTKK